MYDIEPLPGAGNTYKYRVYYTDYSAREWKQETFTWNQGSQPFKLDIKLFKIIDEGKKKTIESKMLILAAGSIGSTEILIKSINTTRTTGQKLSISNRLGMGYSTNGDLLGVISTTKKDIQATRGPIVTSGIKFKEPSNFIYTIEDSSIPKMFSGISHLLPQGPLFRKLLVFVGLGKVQDIMNMITPVQISPFSCILLPLQFSDQDLSKTLLLAGMGTDTYDGTIKPQDLWKNNPNRDMNALNVLNIDFDRLMVYSLIDSPRLYTRLSHCLNERGREWYADTRVVRDTSVVAFHHLLFKISNGSRYQSQLYCLQRQSLSASWEFLLLHMQYILRQLILEIPIFHAPNFFAGLFCRYTQSSQLSNPVNFRLR